jgi:hypothetical protein
MLPKRLNGLRQAVKKVSWPSGHTALVLEGAAIAVLLGIAVYMESPRRNEPGASRCELVDAEGADKSEAAYAQLAVSGYRDVRSRRVTVVAFRDDTDPPGIFDWCEQRWYVAKLVEEFAAAGAAEIVIDKFFGPDTCPRDDTRTIDLISAVQRSTVPVIVGRATHAAKKNTGDSCLILSDSLNFGHKLDANGNRTNQPAVDEGLTRLNSDIRKIPLNWSCYSSDAAFAAGEEPTDDRVGTLSWVAASQADVGLKNEPRLSRFREEGQHPFTSLIDPDALSRIDALSFLCASSAKEEVASRYGVNCAQHPLRDVQIRGRIIMIGEDFPEHDDQHTLFGHQVSGVYLQANYIESLLDDRPMKSLSASWNFAIFVLWLVFLYLIFWIQPEIALVISLMAAFLMRYLLTQLVIFSGLYPHLWVQHLGLAVLLLKYIDSRGHLLVDKVKEVRAHHPLPPH